MLAMLVRLGPRFLLLGVALGVGCGSVQAATNRWERELAAFERADRARPPVPGGVVLFGSSSFRLWTNVSALLPDARIVNRGFGGSHTSDLVEHFSRVVTPHEPRVLLVYGGDNDLASGKSAGQVVADFQALVEQVRKRLPRTRIGFVAIKPSPSRRQLLGEQRKANELVRRFARGRRRVDFLDAATPLLDARGQPDPRCFRTDELHLNSEGYARWAGVLRPYLKRWQ